VLRGLDAAHEARNEEGQPLGIVHRDVSPQNVIVGVDGIPRIIDFGVAKAIGRFESTRPGEVRGKFAYMAPEQMQARPVTRQVDVYAAGVVLWELLAGRKLFDAEEASAVCAMVLQGDIKPPSTENPEVTPELDAAVLRATARELGDRYLTARELLADLEKLERASDDEVGAWVRRLSARQLADRQRLIQDAAPAADGRRLEDLVADLARSAVPALESSPSLSSLETSDTILASTAGIGAEPRVPEPPAPGTAQAGRKGVLVPAALMLVGFLVVVGLFVRFRSDPDTAPRTGAPSSAFPAPAPELSALPSPSDAPAAPSASTALEDPAPIELPATPASASAPSGKRLQPKGSTHRPAPVAPGSVAKPAATDPVDWNVRTRDVK
jgi:serine/threonine-protein kinase